MLRTRGVIVKNKKIFSVDMIKEAQSIQEEPTTVVENYTQEETKEDLKAQVEYLNMINLNLKEKLDLLNEENTSFRTNTLQDLTKIEHKLDELYVNKEIKKVDSVLKSKSLTRANTLGGSLKKTVVKKTLKPLK